MGPALQKQVLETAACAPLEGSENRRVGEWEHKGRRLIVVFCPARADAWTEGEKEFRQQGLLPRARERMGARRDNPKGFTVSGTSSASRVTHGSR
ncbi:MAG: hypothetical protein OXD42_09290 [Rhodospirillaceae bacterium]|nr:hypothetical protein [Rhodospirillaceae bacterium]